MRLTDLLEEMEYDCVQGEIDREISTLAYDSRKVEEGSVFICITGAVRDGHEFAGEVVENGASVLVVEKDVEVEDSVTVLKVENTRAALAKLSFP